MATSYTDILTQDEINFLSTLPEVIEAKNRLDSKSSGSIYLNVRPTPEIKAKLEQGLGITLPDLVPMRWMKGDTKPHIDRGVSQFQNTYLMYLNDSPGELLVDGVSFPIKQGSAYVFNEGLNHETLNTGTEPRLLVGPMSEQGFAVGAPTSSIIYYPTLQDALDNTNSLGYLEYPDYTVGNLTSGTTGGFTSWRIAPGSTGISSQANVYANGSVLDDTGFVPFYLLYPAVPCFLEGTKILCSVEGEEKYVPVEEIRKGTLVKTTHNGFKAVELIGHGTINNTATPEREQNRLYKLTKEKYPELTEDLFITGCHSILVDDITEEQREQIKKELSRIFVTDNKYRLPACVDERAEPWQSEGEYKIWHFALESADDGINFGVYANGGLLVETCSLRFLRNKSNMTFV